MTAAMVRRLGLSGVLMLALLVAADLPAGEIPQADKRSDYSLMSRETQAMQDDDLANPGMLFVLDGEALWSRKAGAENRSCADCHHDAAESMKGVAARYPAYEATLGRPLDLEQRINTCRATHQRATPFAWESKELLALSAFVARQSRGTTIVEPADERLKPFVEAGRDIFQRRQGQLALSCSQCHDDNWGKRLAGAVIPQGHPTGYPVYRLEWQTLGSLQRRLRNCMFGMRAEPYDYGSPDHVALELYLMWRASGLAIDAPAVRP
jgi:sulfur-oxidizing protein SoxA